MKISKKVLSAALVMALVGSMSMTAFASGSGSSCGTVTSETVIAHTTTTSNSGSSASTEAAIPTTSSVAGVTTSTAGVYLASKVNGTAVTTSVANISTAYGLTGTEKPFVKIYNLEEKSSPLAAKALKDAATAAGMTAGPMINIELGKMSAGKFSLLAPGADVTFKVGIPGNFADASKTFAVIEVRPGGAISILQDVDSNPNTVTFAVKGGQAAYAIVKY